MRTLPGEILLDLQCLAINAARRLVVGACRTAYSCQTKPRGDRARYLKAGADQRGNGVLQNFSQQSTITQRLTALAAALKLPAIKRMECFDINHTMGSKRSHPVCC